MSKIIAFSGLSKAGKTTLSRLLARELRCKYVSFGDFVREQAVRNGAVNVTLEYLQNLGQALVMANVDDFCRRVLAKVRFKPGEPIVIDGIRHREVLRAISRISNRQPMKLVYLIASDETRRQRSPAYVDMSQVDSHPVESEVETEIKSMADLVVETDGDKSQALQLLVDWVRGDYLSQETKDKD